MSIPLSLAMTGRVNLIFSRKKAVRSSICRERRKFPAPKSKPNSTRSKTKRTGSQLVLFISVKNVPAARFPWESICRIVPVLRCIAAAHAVLFSCCRTANTGPACVCACGTAPVSRDPARQAGETPLPSRTAREKPLQSLAFSVFARQNHRMKIHTFFAENPRKLCISKRSLFRPNRCTCPLVKNGLSTPPSFLCCLMLPYFL